MSDEVIEQMTEAEYVAGGGQECPYCRSRDITAGSFDSDLDSAWQAVECLSCEKTWQDVYRLVGYMGEEY